MYYIHVEDGQINGAGMAQIINDNYENIEVSKEIYDDFRADRDKYIYKDGEIVLNPEYDNILLQRAKELKLEENVAERDKVLFGGVTYQNILFDSDTDQKINLSEQHKRMSDTDTVLWHGMNNESLLCTKDDLAAIGELIYGLTGFVWNKDAYIKDQIQVAETLEDLANIEIDYNYGE